MHDAVEDKVHTDLAMKMTADLFWTGLLVCLPVLGLTLLVGLVVSVLQVVTQIQETSLTFIPKLLTAGAAMIAFGPWMLRTLCRFAVTLWSQIPSMV
jgi:flagellar biosynthetic protein FliQ